MTYQQSFHREVYALMRDAYEESFTPGSDTVKVPKEPIMMKPDFYRLMANIAVSKLAREGKKAPNGFDIDEEAKHVFAPGGSEGEWTKNPSTPKIPAEMYDTAPFFKSFFEKGIRKNPVSAETDLFQQFKSTHMHMASIYLKTVLGLKDEQFEFPKKVGDQKKLSEDQLKGVMLNQYRRYVISVVILHLIQLAYEMTPSQVNEIMDAVGVNKLKASQLDQKSTRIAFGRALGETMKKVFGGQSLAEGILSKLRSRTTRVT